MLLGAALVAGRPWLGWPLLLLVYVGGARFWRRSRQWVLATTRKRGAQ
jgi:hypothetical protein